MKKEHISLIAGFLLFSVCTWGVLRIIQLEKNLERTKVTVEYLSGRLESIENVEDDVNDIKSNIEEATGRIDDAESRIDDLENRTITVTTVY